MTLAPTSPIPAIRLPRFPLPTELAEHRTVIHVPDGTLSVVDVPASGACTLTVTLPDGTGAFVDLGLASDAAIDALYAAKLRRQAVNR